MIASDEALRALLGAASKADLNSGTATTTISQISATPTAFSGGFLVQNLDASNALWISKVATFTAAIGVGVCMVPVGGSLFVQAADASLYYVRTTSGTAAYNWPSVTL